ncbi:MAG TPA: hypothetical protein VGR46_09350 [Candidatus Limnocylindria bacterium]|jgi:hypothetical protein|nr:hypothetical protein [Candidatus Limnocylindria bacterium]
MVAGTLPGPAGSWTSDAIAVTAGANYDISATVASGGTAATPRVVVSG